MDWSEFKRNFIGFEEAFRLAIHRVPRLPEEWVDIGKALKRVTARTVKAEVDSPSVDSSLKDGYAVISSDVARASPSRPIELKMSGVAGGAAARSPRESHSTWHSHTPP